jgi:formylglycine-generating enzyme required for sulfatase activity
LATEAEWEKAARGGAAGHRFPWTDTDTIDWSRANYCADVGLYSYDVNPIGGYDTTFNCADNPVGYFAPNGYGLYDMAGNVYEFCWDWYGMPYAGGTDPHGPATGTHRVVRGGSWEFLAIYARCAARFGCLTYYASYQCGFRCVKGL